MMLVYKKKKYKLIALTTLTIKKLDNNCPWRTIDTNKFKSIYIFFFSKRNKKGIRWENNVTFSVFQFCEWRLRPEVFIPHRFKWRGWTDKRKYTNIATYRPNQPKGQLNQNSLIKEIAYGSFELVKVVLPKYL